MHINTLFCSYSTLVEWLQNHLLYCPFKKFTGIDCPGCGFQRSVIALFEGHLLSSIQLYPAAIPLLITGILYIAENLFGISFNHRFRNRLLMVCAAIICFSYILKISRQYLMN